VAQHFLARPGSPLGPLDLGAEKPVVQRLA
jgi:hypothetical protein